jgi:hypothetical protein
MARARDTMSGTVGQSQSVAIMNSSICVRRGGGVIRRTMMPVVRPSEACPAHSQALPGRPPPQYFMTRTGVAQVNLSQHRPACTMTAPRRSLRGRAGVVAVDGAPLRRVDEQRRPVRDGGQLRHRALLHAPAPQASPLPWHHQRHMGSAVSWRARLAPRAHRHPRGVCLCA